VSQRNVEFFSRVSSDGWLWSHRLLVPRNLTSDLSSVSPMFDPPTPRSAATYPPTMDCLDCIEAWDFVRSSFMCIVKGFNLLTIFSRSTDYYSMTFRSNSSDWIFLMLSFECLDVDSTVYMSYCIWSNSFCSLPPYILCSLPRLGIFQHFSDIPPKKKEKKNLNSKIIRKIILFLANSTLGIFFFIFGNSEFRIW